MSEQPILVNINTANQDELTTLSGVGPALADRIIAARPFRSVDDLLKVQGIGPALMDSIRSALTVFPQPSPPTTKLNTPIDGKNKKEAESMMDETLEKPEEDVLEAENLAENQIEGEVVPEAETEIGEETESVEPVDDEVEVIEAEAEVVETEEEEPEIEAELEEAGAMDLESTEALALLDGVPEESKPDEEVQIAEEPEADLEEDLPVEAALVMDAEESQPDIEEVALEASQEEPKVEVEMLPEEPLPSGETVTKPETKTVPTVSRGQAIWMMIFSGLLAFLLALGASLGILASLNGGLRYATPSQMTTVRRQVDGLNAQATILQQDLEGLRGRMENLEGLSGRVGSVEENVGQLQVGAEQMRGDLDAAATRMEAFNSELEAVNGEVDEIRGQTEKFDTFLNGLRDLLDTYATE
jgi:competence ComEA-like helix-hairpin-helix protein